MFKPARRSSAKLRLALLGPSGSGKTFSALKIAKGISGKVALIDTERGSGELYSQVTDYDVGQLTPPFTPTKYIEAIKAAEAAGYEIIIIDSLSHAWAGEGGVLDIHDKISKSVRNSFAAWREVTPQHNQLVDAMLGSSAHIIATLRSKTSYEVQNEGNKTKVVKVGLAPVQREGLEYEFTLVLELSVEGHVASASKDRTGLFDGQYFTPSEETGKLLSTWLQGDITTEQEGQEKETKQENTFLLNMLNNHLNQLGLVKEMDKYLNYLHNKYQAFSIEMLTKDQLTEQLVILRSCKEKKDKLEQFKSHIYQLQQEGLAA
jgi:hypothetical protein